MTWYLALMGAVEEMLKPLSVFDFSEHRRCTAPRKTWPPAISRTEFPHGKLGYLLFRL